MRSSRALLVLLLLTIPQVSFSAENRAKDFTLPSATSKSLIHLSDYSGKFVLIKGDGYSTSWFGRTQCVANYIVLNAQFLTFSGNHPE